VVLGRETALKDIRRIKDAVPELELECFAHGAMCIAYSGRCLMSAYLTGRSANSGFCSHSCRWDFRVLSDELKTGEREFLVEERARPGEFFPVVEGEDYTALFSSKDLCMIDYLSQMRDAGVDSLKIEGRMKSLYYTALVTRSYRKRIDSLAGLISKAESDPFVAELDKVAHREFGTGFYFSPEDANKTTKGETTSPYILAGTIGREIEDWKAGATTLNLSVTARPGANGTAVSSRIAAPPVPGMHDYEFISMNKIESGVTLEFVGPDILSLEDRDYILIDPETGLEMEWVCHGHPCIIRTKVPIRERYIARTRDPDWQEGDTTLNRVPKHMRSQ
jgi:putative protease